MTKKFQNSAIFTKENFDKYWNDGFIVIKGMLTDELCEYSNSLARIVADGDYGQIMHLHREEYLISQSSKKIVIRHTRSGSSGQRSHNLSM